MIDSDDPLPVQTVDSVDELADVAPAPCEQFGILVGLEGSVVDDAELTCIVCDHVAGDHKPDSGRRSLRVTETLELRQRAFTNAAKASERRAARRRVSEG